MANATKRQKAIRPSKPMHNDMSRDITSMTEGMVKARMVSAKGYDNRIAYSYWRAVLAWMQSPAEHTKPIEPKRKREKRPRAYHTNYNGENSLSIDEIKAKIKNASAWLDNIHIRIWTSILKARIAGNK